jgi:hypothetical protein
MRERHLRGLRGRRDLPHWAASGGAALYGRGRDVDRAHDGRSAGGAAPAGVPGFLVDTDQLYEAADTDGQEWRELVAAWWSKFGPRWVSAGDLLTLALEHDLLGSIIRDKAQHAQKILLGKAIGGMRDGMSATTGFT